MNHARIAELLAPFLLAASHSGERRYETSPDANRREPAVLLPAQLADISTYSDILLRWNARINLTAVRDPEQIVTRHFGESLFAASHLFPQGQLGGIVTPGCVEGIGGRDPGSRQPAADNHSLVADIGSGAGFPGLPLKIWAPQIAVSLIESNHKKATFLREVIRVLKLTDVEVQTVRAEALESGLFGLVTLRAVERFESILPVAARLIAPRGRLALLIGASQIDEARSVLPDLQWSEPKPIPASQSRILAIAHRQPS